jgi:hypothetical protein
VCIVYITVWVGLGTTEMERIQMSSFDARLRVPGHNKLPVNVVVDIADEVLSVSTGQRKLGDWPLDSLKFSSRSDGFHVKLDDQEIVLSVDDSARFALELGTAGLHRTRTGISRRLSGITPDEQFEDLKRRIDEVAEAIESESVSPERAFGQWLRLLKDINVHHGQGSMPTPLFYRLNTRLLDLIPVPPRVRQPVG